MLNQSYFIHTNLKDYNPPHLPENNCDNIELSQYEFYSSYHTNIFNKVIHFITIPIIMITTAHFLQKLFIAYNNDGLLTEHNKRSYIYSINLLDVVQIFYGLYYFTWSRKIGIIMLIYFEGIIRLLSYLQLYLLEKYKNICFRKYLVDIIMCLLMIFAWVSQFFGHYIEGNRPALMDSLSTAFLTAPMFSLDLVFNLQSIM